MDAVSATIVAGGRANINKHWGWYKYIEFYINLLNLTKPFDSGLKKWMCKAAHHSDGVDSLNSRCWRGERLHHHGGGVCWLFVLLWMDLRRHKLIVCTKWYKNNLKMRLTALLFDPPRRAPHPNQISLKNEICDVTNICSKMTSESIGQRRWWSRWGMWIAWLITKWYTSPVTGSS